MGQEKRWEVINLGSNIVPRWDLPGGYENRGTPHSVRLDGKEQYILPHLERSQAESIERMLNSIVAQHATIG